MFTIEWITLRLSVLFLLFGLTFEIEVIVLLLSFMIIHIKVGVITILYDYVHIKKVKLLFLSLVKVLSIEVSKCVVEFLL
uniref:succinate dehydrogenase hydrophobic subunit n=1 Tax=Mimica arnoldii TaxID=88407 RepID=UPI00279F872B|nr:succinate dehydrogenase hydrophobic subunit [Mimica arnoldii]WGO62526.1 succinate dehydrogenase hydrophobic subunit [Mimica arnoldii]